MTVGACLALVDLNAFVSSLLASAPVNGEPSSTLLVWGIGLFVLAAVLLALEVFIPTGGVLGILAVVAVASSVAAFFRYEPLWGAMALGLYLVLTPFAVYFAFKLWIHSPLTRRLVLDGEDPSFLQEPEEAMSDSEKRRRSRLAALHALVGVEGRAATTLRPVGVVVLEGRRIDAMAEFGVIEAGTRITVVQVLDNQVKVRPVDGAHAPATAERPGSVPESDERSIRSERVADGDTGVV